MDHLNVLYVIANGNVSLHKVKNNKLIRKACFAKTDLTTHIFKASTGHLEESWIF